MDIFIAVLLILFMTDMSVADVNVTQEKKGAYLIAATYSVKPLGMIFNSKKIIQPKIYDDSNIVVEEKTA